jgi:tripartite-type tricarboxylate transporter receptor subunit TctC
MNDLIAGNIQMMLVQIAATVGAIRDGRIRALAATGPARHALLPEVPTLAEQGYPQATATSWGAVMVTAGSPQPAVLRLNAAVREALATPLVTSRMAAAGARCILVGEHLMRQADVASAARALVDVS